MSGRRLRLAALAAALLGASPAAAVDLEGTWYVLVHYQDAESNKPDAWRWEDRIWRFTRQGDGLEWTEYPIVVLEDESGRFERLGTNRQSRMVVAWEPSEAQLADIRDGLQVNPRGVKTKTLRLGEGGSWQSSGGPSAQSAAIITYSEEWSIEGLPDLPVFTRVDSMGGFQADSLEGRTEYRTEEVREAEGELLGRFERDGARVGRFRMIRSGETEKVRGSGLTQEQRLMQMFASQVGVNLSNEQILALADGRIAPGTPISEELREGARADIRRIVEQGFRDQGQDPARFRPQVDSLTAKIEKLLFEEGKSLEEVQRMLGAGELLP